jgi:hypothetical protein
MGSIVTPRCIERAEAGLRRNLGPTLLRSDIPGL